MPTTDDDIIHQAQQGEPHRFLELFDRYYPAIERYARRLVQDPDMAADLASETFLRAYQKLDIFRVGEGVSYAGYLFMICRRLTLNEIERRQTRPSVSLDACSGVETLRDTGPLPLEQLLDDERSSYIRLALLQLTESDREIICLAFEKELSRSDIRHVLGKPSVSAVTSHLHRAMRNLRSVLVQQGYFSDTSELERR